MSDKIFYPALDRGTKDIGWLKSNFTFSFSNYYQPVKSGFGTLMAFNDDTLQAGKGFGIHPHQNMEIISILLQGKLNHKDNLGYNTELNALGVQIMSAGTGILHEEYNIGNEEVKFLQIWIQPKLQNVTPRYQQRHFELNSIQDQLTTLVSSDEGLGHCWINQNAKILFGNYQSAQSILHTYVPLNKCVYIFLISGAITIADQSLIMGDALGIWDTDTVKIDIIKPSTFIVIETVINQK
jgi:quercetin 2,3-dioxygenase